MKQMLFTLLLVFAAPALLISCNKDKGSGATAVAPAPGGVNTSNYGPGGCIYAGGTCLPQGTCPTNFGMQGLECLPATGVNGICSHPQIMTAFGCLAQGACPEGKAMYENTCVSEVQSRAQLRPRYAK